MRNWIYFLVFSLIFSACSTHRGALLAPQCNGDCSFESVAYGSAETGYFLGIGGNNSEAMLFEARRNMSLAFPLKKGSFYDNIAIDYKTSRYLLFYKLKVTITSDIVSHGDIAEQKVYTDNYEHSLAAGKKTCVNSLHLADSVVYVSGSGIKKGVLIAIFKNQGKVLMTNNQENYSEASVSLNNLFAIDNEEIEDSTGFEANQIIEYTSGAGKKETTTIKEVVGLQVKNVLLKISINGKDSYKVVPVQSLKYK